MLLRFAALRPGESVKRQKTTIKKTVLYVLELDKSDMQKSGKLIAEITDDDLQTNDFETTIELNFAVLKFKHTVKKKNK